MKLGTGFDGRLRNELDIVCSVIHGIQRSQGNFGAGADGPEFFILKNLA